MRKTRARKYISSNVTHLVASLRRCRSLPKNCVRILYAKQFSYVAAHRIDPKYGDEGALGHWYPSSELGLSHDKFLQQLDEFKFSIHL